MPSFGFGLGFNLPINSSFVKSSLGLAHFLKFSKKAGLLELVLVVELLLRVLLRSIPLFVSLFSPPFSDIISACESEVNLEEATHRAAELLLLRASGVILPPGVLGDGEGEEVKYDLMLGDPLIVPSGCGDALSPVFLRFAFGVTDTGLLESDSVFSGCFVLGLGLKNDLMLGVLGLDLGFLSTVSVSVSVLVSVPQGLLKKDLTLGVVGLDLGFFSTVSVSVSVSSSVLVPLGFAETRTI